MAETSGRLIEVYNALQNTNYPLDTPVIINALRDVLYKNRMNDVSFLMAQKFISMWEHQSTLNYNITVRFLMYYARELEKVISAMIQTLKKLAIDKKTAIDARMEQFSLSQDEAAVKMREYWNT